MTFFDYLEKVRQRPMAERKKILFVWTVTGTVLIVFLWLINTLVFKPGAIYDGLASGTAGGVSGEGFWSRNFGQIQAGFNALTDNLKNLFK